MKAPMLLGLAAMLLASPSSAACYGAAAISLVDGKSGTSWGSATSADAERRALHECRVDGGRECRIISWERKMHCPDVRQDALRHSRRPADQTAAVPQHHYTARTTARLTQRHQRLRTTAVGLPQHHYRVRTVFRICGCRCICQMPWPH